ncbi:PAC2 family protein [Leucobacter sp. HY1908]
MTDTLRPTPRVLLAAFQGWGDAGEAATDTLQHLAGLLGAEPLHTIGASGFIDFQAHRPKLTRAPGGARSLEWPDTRLFGPVARPADDWPVAQPVERPVDTADELPAEQPDEPAQKPADDERVRRIDGSPVTEVYLLAGYEPAYHWQDFAEEIVDLVDTWAIDTVILIGSMYAEAPHSRQIATTITSENAKLREASGAELSGYEGPVGIMTVIEMALTAADVPTMSLWAQVPHYVHSAPSPKATLALLDKLEELLDVVIPRGELLAQSNDWESHINRIADGDEEMSQYIRTLERARDEALAAGTTGDAIALEFEKLLGAVPGEIFPGAPHPRDAAAGPDPARDRGPDPEQDQGPEEAGPQPSGR